MQPTDSSVDQNKNRVSRIALLLLISGLFLPVATYPLTTLTESGSCMRSVMAVHGANYWARPDELQIIPSFGQYIYPYKHILVLGICMFFTGLFSILFKLFAVFASKETRLFFRKLLDRSLLISTALLLIIACLLLLACLNVWFK